MLLDPSEWNCTAFSARFFDVLLLLEEDEELPPPAPPPLPTAAEAVATVVAEAPSPVSFSSMRAV